MLFRFMDVVADAAMPVFQSTNTMTAVRDIRDQIKSQKVPRDLAKDLALYQVGETSENPGELRITAFQDPKFVMDLKEVIKDIDENG